MKNALLMIALLVLTACATTSTHDDMMGDDLGTNGMMGDQREMDEMMDDMMGDEWETDNMMGDGMHGMMDINSEEQFVVEMIPHHQEAVDTSKIVFASTDNPELKDLAGRIIDAQETEIAMMKGWVANWYEGGYEPEYVNMMPDLDARESRDQAYLHGMIMHHRMAVEMAEDVLELDPRPEVAEFARGVIDVQTNEIAEMRNLLG